MSRVYRITQKVEHTITVLADSLDDANRFADELSDDGFADQSWGDTHIKMLPKTITQADEDITDPDGDD